jgi:hypothetical protein
MKTKQQKRIEAIERLEREPRLRGYDTTRAQEIRSKRLAEAARLRNQFGMPSRDSVA